MSTEIFVRTRSEMAVGIAILGAGIFATEGKLACHARG